MSNKIIFKSINFLLPHLSCLMTTNNYNKNIKWCCKLVPSIKCTKYIQEYCSCVLLEQGVSVDIPSSSQLYVPILPRYPELTVFITVQDVLSLHIMVRPTRVQTLSAMNAWRSNILVVRSVCTFCYYYTIHSSMFLKDMHTKVNVCTFCK